MRLRRWVAALAWAVSAVSVAGPLSVAHAAGGVSIVDLPVGIRYEPRAAEVVGVGDSGFLYVVEGQRSPNGFNYGPTVAHWRSFTGEDAVIAGADENTLVLGNRLVSGDLQQTRLVTDANWQPVSVPAGYGYETATGDGLILTSGAWNSQSVSFLPWSGGTPTPVTGFPSGRIIDSWALMDTKPVDAHGVILRARSADGSNGTAYEYVDTSTGEAQSVPSPPDSTDAIGLSPTGIAWRTVSGGVNTLQSVDRPAAGQPFGAVSSRPAPAAISTFQFLRLLPVGSDIMAFQGLNSIYFERDHPYPVLAVAPDGTTRTVAGWGHGVHEYSPGVVVLVAGPDPATEAIDALTVATEDAQTVVTLPPVAAKFDSVTSDEGRVVYATDTDSVNAVMEQSLADDQGALSLGAPVELGKQAETYLCGASLLPSSGYDYSHAFGCTSVFAGGGSTAFSHDFDGTITDTVVRPGQSNWTTTQQILQGVDGPWLHDTSTPSWLNIDTAATRNATVGSEQDGVVYSPIYPGRIRELDLATGQGGAFDVPQSDCTNVDTPQVAGSWAYTTCSTSTNAYRSVVWDRSGAHPPWNPPPDHYLLGNGFLLRTTPDGSLQWTDLSDSTHTWATLTTSLGMVGSIAASNSSSLATVAWTDGATAHVAELPVMTTPMPPHPSDLAQAPAQPNGLAAAAGDGQVALTWNAPAPGTEIDYYQLNINGTAAILKLRGSATSTVVNQLPNGSPDTFSLMAVNQFGTSPAASVTTTPGASPSPTPVTTATPASPSPTPVTTATPASPSPTPVTTATPASSSPTPVTTATPVNATPPVPVITGTSVDQVTSTLTVHWTEAAVGPGQDAPTSYVIDAGPYETTVADTNAQSAQLLLPVAGSWPVTVTAKSPGGSAASQPLQVAAPGADTTPPSTPKTSLLDAVVHAGIAPKLRFSATDDRRVARFNIRSRSAAFGQPLGAWSQSAAWTGVTATSITTNTRTPGSTHCYSVNAVDAAGNTSAWSAPICQVVRLGDTGLTRATPGWIRSYNVHYDSGSALLSTRWGAQLTRTHARGNRLWLVVEKCPTCGTVGVYSAGVLVKKVNLYATRTVFQQLIQVDWTRDWAGTLALKQNSGGRPAIIDAIALRAY